MAPAKWLLLKATRFIILAALAIVGFCLVGLGTIMGCFAVYIWMH